MKKFILNIVTLCVAVSPALSQTFNGAPTPLVDGSGATSIAQVNGLNAANINSAFGLEKVTININHPIAMEVVFYLESPDGTLIWLNQGNGAVGANFTNTVFTQNAGTPISAGTPPFSGNYKPYNSLAMLNNGQVGNGAWKLNVYDGVLNGQTGNIVSWSITFSNTPATFLTSSNLPIVVITGGINDSHSARMGIISNPNGQRNNLNDPFNAFNNKISYYPRGQSSLGFEQQTFKVETFDVNGLPLDTTILGMPAEHEWILYGPYNDRTLLRNVLMYKLCNSEGQWAPRTAFCEVVINGSYSGVYVMMESIKRDKKRVDISKLDIDDNAGDSITGGYIFKTDWDGGVFNFTTSHGLQFGLHYPRTVNWTQKTYLSQYIDSLETALYGANFADPLVGYTKYMDVGSFVDFMIWNEVAFNQDCYHASTYYHKENIKNDHGQIKAGPIWDFNFGFGISPWYGSQYQGYIYQMGNSWMTRLSADTIFQNKVKCRWLWLRTNTLNLSYINHSLDSMALVLNEGMIRHFERYPIMGVGCCYNNYGAFPIPADYAGEISYLKNWLNLRVGFIDNSLYGHCYSVGIDNKPIAEEALFYTYPNPFEDKLTVNYFLNEPTPITIQIFDQLGQMVYNNDFGIQSQGDHTQQIIGLENFPRGIYLLKQITNKKVYSKTIVKQ